MTGHARDDLRSHDWTWSRREFFSLAGWGALLGTTGVLCVGFIRFMFPRVLFEPDTKFSAGTPSEFPPNTVSDKLVKSHRTWIAHHVDEDGASWIIAIYASCTHLGCTPRWFPVENKFKCPCHGSGFRGFDPGRGRDILAINFEGPAPRPLERLKVWVGDDGSIWVDRGVKFLFEKGQWGDPAARARI